MWLVFGGISHASKIMLTRFEEVKANVSIIEVQIAGRNGILVEFYYLEESNFKVIAISSCREMGGAFSKNYNLIPSSYN